MADQLVTQVRQDDQDPNAGFRPPPQQYESKGDKKDKQPSCWWRYFCCCCAPKSSSSDSDGKGNRGNEMVQTNSSAEKKVPQIGNPDGRPESKPKGYVPPTPPPPLTKYLLPPMTDNKKCLVLDLDETLVHSSFKPIPNPDFVISIELENVIHKVYVRKRPGVDNFLRVVGEKFEVVVFTASLAKYADPLLDILDKSKVIKVRLFREACVQHYGNYVKDLTHLGRALEHTVIIDNSPFSYMFQPDNAIPITSWFNDRNDRQLYDLIPFLDTLAQCDDVVAVLQRHKMTFNSTVA
jgi:RNA polymerase II subunit A small phosphatase-like protein